MSLLLEALKKAEKAKDEAQRQAGAGSGSESGLQLEAAPAPAVEPRHITTRDELPSIAQSMDITSADLGGTSGATGQAEHRSARAAASRSSAYEAPPAERAAAKKVFEAKFREPNPKLPFYIVMGMLAAFGIGTVAYFWYQLRPPPPLVNANPPRTAPEAPAAEAIEGKRGWPRVKPPFPAVKGLFGRPTIVNNVETLAAVPAIVTRGAPWWQSIGVASATPGGMPSWGPKLMGVSGHVARPGCFEAPLGIPLSTLVNEYCGGMRNGKRFKGAVAGGVSMGVLGTDQFDVPMDFDIGHRANVLGLGTACPTIFDEDTDMVAVCRNIVRFFKNESCGQCTPCREGSGWAYQLLTRIERGDATTADLDLLVEVSGSMGLGQGTTICGLADGVDWAVKTIVGKFRADFERRVKPRFIPVHLAAR